MAEHVVHRGKTLGFYDEDFNELFKVRHDGDTVTITVPDEYKVSKPSAAEQATAE